MISVACSCGRRFKAEDRHAGKRTRCPVCGNLLVIGPAAGAGPSGVNDNGDVPSWWFPTEAPPKPATTASAVPPTRSGSNPDDIQTMVIPVRSGSHTDVPGVPPAGPGGSGWTPKGILGIAGGVLLLAAAAVAWVSWPVPAGDKGLIPRNPDQKARVGPQAGEQGKAAATPDQPDGSARPADDEPGKAQAVAAAKPAGVAAAEPGQAESGFQLLIPAYFYPAGDGLASWQRLIDAASKVRIVVVANPSNGPGDLRNPDYFLTTQAASDKGIRVIGYIATNYGKRPMNEIKNEIVRWIQFYPHIQGFFFDQQSNAAQHVGDYVKIRDHARQELKGALVITNPGSMCADEYFIQNVADVICVFANYQGFAQFDPPAVLKQFGPARFAALAYNIPNAAAMHKVVEDAGRKHIGYLFVGDAPKGDNPFARLPAYWDELVKAVAPKK